MLSAATVLTSRVLGLILSHRLKLLPVNAQMNPVGGERATIQTEMNLKQYEDHQMGLVYLMAPSLTRQWSIIGPVLPSRPIYWPSQP